VARRRREVGCRASPAQWLLADGVYPFRWRSAKLSRLGTRNSAARRQSDEMPELIQFNWTIVECWRPSPSMTTTLKSLQLEHAGATDQQPRRS
jgi:hypothetical protein